MTKYIIVGIIAIGIFSLIYMSVNANIEQKAPLVTNKVDAVQTQEQQYDISVDIDKVKRENGQTTVYLTLSNHAKDLTKIDPMPYTTLDNVVPKEYIISEDNMGGHHVESELIFKGDLFGTLTFGVNSTQTYTLTID